MSERRLRADVGTRMRRMALSLIAWLLNAWPILAGEAPELIQAVFRADEAAVERLLADGVPADHFATVATSRFTLPAGRYLVRVLSDDGVRVKLDGETILEDWTWHPPRKAEVEVTPSGGEHRLEVEHFEIDGHAVLSVVLVPVEGER